MTTKQKEALNQMTRDVRVKITLVDKGNRIESLIGKPVSGSISLSSETAFRRGGSINLALENASVSSSLEQSKWFNKEISVQIGLKDNLSPKGEIIWFPSMGIFSVLNVSFTRTPEEHVADFQLGDLMSYLDGSISGQIGTSVQILNAGVSIDKAIYKVSTQLGNVDLHSIEVNATEAKLPYRIEQEPGSSVLDLLMQLVEIYRGYELFYDGDGVLVCQRIRNEEKDQVVWDFSDSDDVRVSNVNSADITNVKNSSTVWGRILETGYQVYWRYRNRFLRHHITKTINPDYEIFEIPFTYDLEVGDICHIKDPIQAEERLQDISGNLLCQIPENISGRFKTQVEEKERSYVWTRYFNYTERVEPDEDGIFRLSRWASPRFDIVAKPVEQTEEVDLIVLKQMQKASIGEMDSRYFQVRNIEPRKIEEVAEVVPDTAKTEYETKEPFHNVSDVKVFLNGERRFVGFRATNRNGKGRVIFESPVKGATEVMVQYDTRTVSGEIYKKPILITYEYETDKDYWVELDFLVVPEFRIEEIGERALVVNDNLNFNNTQAKLRSEFNLWSSSNFAEQITVELLPLYNLEPNRKIRLKDERTGIDGEYLIQSIEVPLNEENMSLVASKVQNNNAHDPDSRNPLPVKAPNCRSTSYIYPETFNIVYRYDFNENEFYISQATALEKRIFLSMSDIEELISRAKEIPFDSETEKGFFIEKTEFVISSLVFSTNEDKMIFMNSFNDQEIILKSIQSAPTSGQIKQESQEYLEEVVNVHYSGDKTGFQKIYYDLGGGNTFDKISIFQKQRPPQEYFDRYEDLECEEAWELYPLPETSLPERPYQENPSKETYDFRTRGYLRENNFMYNYFNFYPHEYDIKVIVRSHFCANLRRTTWDLVRLGKMDGNFFYPTHEGELQPIVRDDIIYLGAVPSKNYKINFNIGMGNTKDRFEVIYKDKPLEFDYYVDNQLIDEKVSFIEHNPLLNSWRSLRGYIVLNWQPEDFDNKVAIRVSSFKP